MSRSTDDHSETRNVESTTPRVQDAAGLERRSSRVTPLTEEQRKRFAALGPARFQDAEHQRWAQSHRTHQSLSESGKAAWQAMFTAHGREALSAAGKLGWATTVSRYGEEFAYDRLADRRRADPTVPERKMITLLAHLGQREREDYRREVWVAPHTHVDFAWPADRLALVRWNLPHCQDHRAHSLRGDARHMRWDGHVETVTENQLGEQQVQTLIDDSDGPDGSRTRPTSWKKEGHPPVTAPVTPADCHRAQRE